MGQLVLSRKVGQRLLIGEGKDAVAVMVVRIGYDAVRLGIEANRNVKVVREELVARDQLERAEADALREPFDEHYEKQTGDISPKGI